MKHRHIFLLLLITLTPLTQASIKELFPDNASTSLKVKEDISANGTRRATLTLEGKKGRYPWLASLDKSSRPSCHTLEQEILSLFKLKEEDADFHCFQPKTPDLSISLTLAEDPKWKLNEITWHNGWAAITAKLAPTVEIDNKAMMTALFEGQTHLLESSHTMARQWSGLGTAQQELPQTALSFLYGSKSALFNGFVTIWHGFEIVEHGGEVIDALQNFNLGNLSFNLLALALHTLDGFEHADDTYLGNFVHLNFKGDIIKASPAPHGTNIAMSGTSLGLAAYGLISGLGYPTSKTDAMWKAFGYLHTAFHVYEFYEALSSWYYGESAHEHHH